MAKALTEIARGRWSAKMVIITYGIGHMMKVICQIRDPNSARIPGYFAFFWRGSAAKMARTIRAPNNKKQLRHLIVSVMRIKVWRCVGTSLRLNKALRTLDVGSRWPSRVDGLCPKTPYRWQYLGSARGFISQTVVRSARRAVTVITQCCKFRNDAAVRCWYNGGYPV